MRLKQQKGNTDSMKLELSGIDYTISPKLHLYAEKKVQKLEKYVPRSARASAHVEVRLKQKLVKGVNHSTCEITLHLPHENLQASETTQHMYAAVDVATAHLRNQIASYKEKYMPAKLRHRLRSRFRPETPAE
jgi:ribosomal subunit interface protein